MSHWPTFNIATIMTAVMVPATGYHNTTVWYGSNPKIRGDNNLQMEWIIERGNDWFFIEIIMQIIWIFYRIIKKIKYINV